MVDFKRPLKMNLTERRHNVHSLIAPPINESFDGGAAAARGLVGDWRADEIHSSFHQPAVFLVGCSDYSGRQTFTYDEFGNKSEETNYFAYDSSATKVIFTKNYDSNDNWRKETVSAVSDSNGSAELTTPSRHFYFILTYNS